jgi:hypothetical protein
LPICYEIDPHRKLVVTTLSGTLSFDESVAHHRKLGADPAFDPSFRELMDGSGVKRVALLSPAIFSLSISCPFNSAACRAIYAGDNSTNYAIARMFQALAGDKHGEIAVFKSRDEALAWLKDKPPRLRRQA